MGQGSIGACYQKEEDHLNEPKFIKLHPNIGPKKSKQSQNEYSPESLNRGYGSQFGRSSSKDLFQKEYQIGQFLCVDESTSYNGKMKKWRKVLDTTPIAQVTHTNNGEKSYFNFKSTTAFEGTEVNHENQVDDPSLPVFEINANSFDMNIQQNYQFVANKLDSAVVCYNIMDNVGFKQLLLEGPPDMRLRWSCWKTALLKRTQWDELESKLENTTCENEELILKDIKRTISWHPFYQQIKMTESVGHNSLTRILKALVNTYPKLGYCQGMNFLAGFILLVSGGDEFQSYTYLAQLMRSPKFMLYFAYKAELPFLIFLEVFIQHLIKQHHPKIHQHIIDIELPNSFWLTKIILSLFLYSFKISMCLRFWDYLMATNIFGLVSIVLAMIEIHTQTILKMDLGEFMEWFQLLQERDIDQKTIIMLAQQKFAISKSDVANFAKKQDCKNNEFVENLQNYDNQSKFRILYNKMIQ